MSDNTVQVIENITTLEITSSTESETSVVEIVQSGAVNLELTTILPSSGNYSLVGHSHSSSDITDFNSSVSGLLPVKNISAGSGIGISNNSGDFTVSVTGTFALTGEQVDDRVSDLLKSGSYVNLDYNDSLDSLTISVTGLQPSGNYSFVGHSHDISNINNLQNALDSKQPSGVYASGVHYHISLDITDFNNSVSGLLPVKNISSGSGISIINNSGDFTVAVTGQFGLTSEEVDDRVNSLLVGGSNIVLNYDDLNNQLTISTSGLQSSGNYSVVGHQHNTSDITNFNSGVSGLIPTVSGNGYITSSFANNNYSISVTGLQPSGNYSVVGHSHTLSDITDFNSSVSGLLPVKNVVGSGYAVVSSSSGIYTISTSGLQPSGNYSLVGHTHTASDVTDFSAAVTNKLTTDLVGGYGISLSYDNTYDKLTISTTENASVLSLGSVSGTYPINFNVDRMIQTLSLGGSATTFTKGSGWPATSGESADVVLKIIVSSGTSITWTIVNEWYDQPIAGPLASGIHLFLLRGVGTIVEGHYIGNKTN